MTFDFFFFFSAKCTAYIALNHEYPAIPPVFNVQMELPNKTVKYYANDDAVRVSNLMAGFVNK